MRKVKNTLDKPEFSPARSVDEREKQMMALAVDCAEKQMRDGTASAQVICHYLKLASTRDRIERELMEKQKEVLSAKIEMLESAKRTEELYLNALEAMKSYSGNSYDE